MARSRSAASQTRTAESEYREIIAWYERELERAAPPTDLRWEPIKIGPTWRYENGWVLPAVTLGWRNLAWAGMHLKNKHGQPWTYTLEQARFKLWEDAIDPETGEFLYPTSVFQRLKGHGKDPFGSCDATIDICSEDAVFSHWRGDVPVGMQQPNAWVQVVAVSQVQTQNTMKLFPSLIPAETRKKYGVQIGKLNVWARGDEAQIEAVTSNPMAIEGGRPTKVIRNETQNWNTSNGGHAMAGAIEGNAAKSEGGAARILDICNAYRPGEESVGQKQREAFNATQGVRCPVHADLARGDWPECVDCQRPKAMDFGMLYDSLEAPPEAPLTAEAAPSVIEAIRGDSVWLNTRRIVQSILNSSNSASESRRKWYNQITAAEDAWADPKDIKAGERDFGLEAGDKIVMFGDGSKSDDATGLVGCRVSDGHLQVLHVQQPKKGQIVDRDAVDHAVIEAMAKFKVVAFWFDPSHARDDDAEGDNRFWWPLVDEWSKRYGRKLKCHPVKTGNRAHAVAFDMATEMNQKTFVEGAEQLAGEFDGQSVDPESARVTFMRSQWLIEHLGNAKQAPGKHGISVRKDNRESRHKIDLAVCAIGARLLRRIYLLSMKTGTPGKGRVLLLDD